MDENNHRYNLEIFLMLMLVLGPVHSTNCPDTWTADEGSCYLFAHGKAMSFFEAEHYCRQHEAHLVHIETAEENAFLEDYIRPYKDNFWIGLTDELVEGRWRWYDTKTKPNFTNWGPGQPSDSGHNEDCAHFYTGLDLKWNDVSCTGHSSEPLCEIRVADVDSIVGK